MKYVRRNNKSSIEPFHYILLLDASGSMRGKAWDKLIDGIKEFVEIRIDFGLEDRMTIIQFYREAEYICRCITLKEIDLNGLKRKASGTNFGKAFDLVIETIQDEQCQTFTSNPTENLDFIIIFMSDGQSAYPDRQLQILLTMKIKIDQFWTVAVGKTKMDVLEKINKTMNGTFKHLKDCADLVQVYAEIADN